MQVEGGGASDDDDDDNDDDMLTQLFSTLEVEKKINHGKAFLAVQVVPHFV